MAVSMIRAKRRPNVGHARDDGRWRRLFGVCCLVNNRKNRRCSPVLLFRSKRRRRKRTFILPRSMICMNYEIIILFIILWYFGFLWSAGGPNEKPVGLRAVLSLGRSYLVRRRRRFARQRGADEKKNGARARNRCTYVRQHNELRYGGKQLCTAPRTDTAARATCAYSYAAHAATMFFPTFVTPGARWPRTRRGLTTADVGHPFGGHQKGLKKR